MDVDDDRLQHCTQSSLRDSCGEALARLQATLERVDPTSAASKEIRDAMALVRELLRNAESLESRYRSLFDAVPDAVMVHDRDGRINDANEATLRLYGYSREEILRLNLFDLSPDLTNDRIDEVWRTFRLGHTETVTADNQRFDGSRFPVEVHSNMFLDGDEKRIVTVARSLLARREAEQTILDSERRYRQLFNAIDKGILVQDRKGMVVSANPAAERMLQISEQDLIERRFDPSSWKIVDSNAQLIEERDLPPYMALRTGYSVESKLVGVFNPIANAYFWFSISSLPQFHDGDPRPFQVTSLFSDITALKRQSVLFDRVQELASIGGWEIDFRRDQIYLSREMYRLHGFETEGARTQAQYLSCFITSDAKRLQHAIDVARQSGQAFDLEVRVQSSDGARRWLRLIGQNPVAMASDGNLIGVAQDISERKKFEEGLRRQSLTDSLTGLSNRDDLIRQLSMAIDDAQPGFGPVLLLVDLDRFKVINDLLGHSAGDGLLVAAAQRLRKLAGRDILVSRFGGDEFMLMITGEHDEALPRQLALRITEAFSDPFPHSGEEFTITASVGIAQFPNDGATFQQLINHADAAMSDAKRRGRNNWQQFSPQLARTLTDRLLVETQLRRALDNQEFYLHFQPQVDLESGRVVGAEALLRWRNRLLGELSPDLFISHAENTGDIVRIGAWVIRESCRQLRQWRDSGLALRGVAVNVSYRQFLGENLPEIVLEALKEFGLPGEALELEMTERVLIEDVPDTLETFNTLRGLGVSLVIDDFGEGYSALNYLRRLPFNGIKISHNFMHGIPGNAADTSICEAIIRIAQSLGLNVIAEGVETETQRSFLLKQGTTLAQGFLFAKPMSADAFDQFARGRLRP